MKPVILHISNDYPDTVVPEKTQAVRSLVDGTPQYRHVVYSLNRVDGWKGMATLAFGADRTAVVYGAMPKGLFWDGRMDDLARWIVADLKAKNIVPDIVQAHKFTIEGVIGLRVARALSRPLVCDIQGHTDVRLLRAKRDLRKVYREIAERAAVIFPYAPWAIKTFEKIVGIDKNKCICLPVMPGFDRLTPSAPVHADRLVTVFNLDRWKLKNLPRLAQAVSLLARHRPGITLDVFGAGSPQTLLALDLFLSHPQRSMIKLRGPAVNQNLPQTLGGYAAFVLPGRSETYGLVFAEALFCGLPVLYPRDRAIDGYFDSDAIGYACDPASVQDIADGIGHILDRQAALKQGIATMQENGGLDFIRRDAILAAYGGGLDRVLKSG